jgi:hypothetical protein
MGGVCAGAVNQGALPKPLSEENLKCQSDKV